MDYIRLTDAAKEYDVNRNKLARWIREKKLTAYQNPRDSREILLDRAELEELLQIRPKE
jgi:hypothetical protein